LEQHPNNNYPIMMIEHPQHKLIYLKNVSGNIRNLKSRTVNKVAEENEMKNQPKRESKKLLCPKAGTATSSPKYWMFLAGDKCLLAAVCVFLVLARVIFFYSPLI
jgi:hypothetical protein